MPRTLKVGPLRRVGNVLMGTAARTGFGPGHLYILTTRGRDTGKPHSHPVQLVIEGDQKWLVAPYGVVDWVKNARATGRVHLRRGREAKEYTIEDAETSDAGRVLKKYVKLAPVVWPYMDAGLSSSEEEFAREAATHPVFRLIPA
ncbi:MAG: nitroreductase family deazaflavin-dependent oxidoreductase [Actinomycetota bacterium]|nr:nitroreductase family deazaflavin-dependent oxidoreductase [Actinomycetota bacterium]